MAFTVQLTAQRDSLMNDLDKSRQHLKQAKMDVDMAKAQRNVEATGLRQRKNPVPQDSLSVNPNGDLTNPSKQFTLVHLIMAAVIFYLLGLFYQRP